MPGLYDEQIGALTDERRAELRDLAAEHGLSVEQVMAARMLGMDVARYAALARITDVDEYRAARPKLDKPDTNGGTA